MSMNLNRTLWLDTEVFSAGNLKTQGTYRNAEDSECLVVTYAYENEPVKEWDVTTGEEPPEDLVQYLSDPTIQIAMHNASYDRVQMEAWGWGLKYDLDPRRFLCTMTWAMMCRLPASLSGLCAALGVATSDSKIDGSVGIKTFCGLHKNRKDGVYRIYPKDKPEEWADFLAYARADVQAMRACAHKLPNVFSDMERDLYALTEDMNDRGILIDVDLAMAALDQASLLKSIYADDAKRVTGDDGFNIASQPALLAYLSSCGVAIPNAQRGTLEEMLSSSAASTLPDRVVSLLSTRIKSNKASVAKYATVMKVVNSDNRFRGGISFYGAGTGRDSGRKFQVQNLARPSLLGKNLSMEEAVSIVKQGSARLYFNDPMQLLSDTVRGLIIPSEGMTLCDADLASIEGRVLPWLAGEDWKVEYFRKLDAGEVKYDSYELSYALAFGVDPSTVTKDQRTLGKPIDLASGFGGGVAALMSFAAIYRIDITKMAKAATEAADPIGFKKVEDSYEWFEEKNLLYGLTKEVWCGLYYIIQTWRSKNPKVKEYWALAEDSFRQAIRNPGLVFPSGRGVSVMSSQGWVYVTLPSGRVLVYPNAKLEGTGPKAQISYEAVNFTRKFARTKTYGGKLVENYTQAVARDVLFHNLKRVEDAGFNIVMRVHDQVVAEAPTGSPLTGELLAKLISTPHSWCHDLPLAATGENLTRFQK